MPRRPLTASLLATLCLGSWLPTQAETNSLKTNVSAESLAIEFAEEKALGSSGATISGQVSVDDFQATGFSQNAIDSLTINGLEGNTENVDEIGSGTFSVGSVLVKGLRNLQDSDELEVDRLELRDLDLDFDQLIASLATLDFDTGTANHDNRFTLEALALDLDHLIAQAPKDDRTPLRTVSNLLTNGSGVLRMDAETAGRWESGDTTTRLIGTSHISADDAFGWTVETDLTVRLPEGEALEAFLAEKNVVANMQDVTLLGGNIEMTLAEEGLLERLPASLAATQGITEAQLMDQAHTQADGYGQMYGPEVKKIATGLLAMMEGEASALDIHLTVPAENNLEMLSSDPLALPEKFDMKVERRSTVPSDASLENPEKAGQKVSNSPRLEAPNEASAGAKIKVDWQGPHYRKDWIGVFPVDAAETNDYINFSYVDEEETPLTLAMPPEPGDYELRYIQYQEDKVLAKQIITVE